MAVFKPKDRVRVGPTVKQAPGGAIKAGPEGVPNAPPTGYVLAKSSNPDLQRVAVKLLSGDYGDVTSFEVDDRRYVARVEPHPPDPPVGPAVWHKGVTVYVDPNLISYGVSRGAAAGAAILVISALSALYLWRSHY